MFLQRQTRAKEKREEKAININVESCDPRLSYYYHARIIGIGGRPSPAIGPAISFNGPAKAVLTIRPQCLIDETSLLLDLTITPSTSTASSLLVLFRPAAADLGDWFSRPPVASSSRRCSSKKAMPAFAPRRRISAPCGVRSNSFNMTFWSSGRFSHAVGFAFTGFLAFAGGDGVGEGAREEEAIGKSDAERGGFRSGLDGR